MPGLGLRKGRKRPSSEVKYQFSTYIQKPTITANRLDIRPQVMYTFVQTLAQCGLDQTRLALCLL